MRFIERPWRVTALVVSAWLTGCVQPPTPVTPAPADPVPSVTRPPAVRDPAARPARNWDDYRVRAARRIVENNAPQMFAGTLPDRLRSIPVLTVHLARDGSVRSISVMRQPRFSPETVKMAMEAIRRAAPFEAVGHLPPPWQFNETFLYNDDLKFQLRSLVETP